MEVELRVLGPVDYHFHKQHDQWSLTIFTTSCDLHNQDPHPHLLIAQRNCFTFGSLLAPKMLLDYSMTYDNHPIHRIPSVRHVALNELNT